MVYNVGNERTEKHERNHGYDMRRKHISPVAVLAFACAISAADAASPVRPKLSVFQMHVEEMARQRGVPVEEAVRAVRDWGVTGADLWFAPEQLASNAKMLSGGLVPATLVVGMDLAHTNDIARRDAAIAYAKRVGSPRIMLVPGHLREGEDRDTAWAAMKPNLADFLRCAEKAGIGVDLEDFDGHTVVGSRVHLRRAFAAFPSFGHALDTGNYHYWQEDVLAAQREFADRVRHVHVKDRAADDPTRSVAAGTGIVPVRKILAHLDEAGYAGWLTIECFGSTNMWDDVRDSAAFLTRTWHAPEDGAHAVGFKGADPRATQLRAVAKPPLRVLFVGAHPDDTDILCPAASMRLVRSGARVKWLAMTNGDRGHQFDDSATLARRRRYETLQAAKITGIEEYMVSSTSDCHLVPSLEERAKMTKVIREFKPHIIVIHRTGDYHPDHRAAGQIVMDATYLSCVPLWAGEYPCEEGLIMPSVFFYMDRFTAPTPSRCDLVIGADDELHQASEALACHESQLYEWLPPEKGLQNAVPPASDHAARVAFAQKHWIDPVHYGQAKKYAREIAQCWPDGGAPKAVECFEVSEYCRLPSDWERKELEKAGFRFVPHELAPREK